MGPANLLYPQATGYGATMVGIPARSTLVDAGQAASAAFLPYGTPCSETFDPATQKLEILQCEVEQLRKRLAEVIAERDATREGAATGHDAAERSRA